MSLSISVNHVTYDSDASFEAFTARFEGRLGRHDISAYQDRLKGPQEAKGVEQIIHAQEGSSGFMLFATYDHGALLAIKGAPRKARQYVIGNPLIAARMTEHDIRAALYAPLRVLIYAHPSGKTRVEYDLPSSLFGQFQDEKVTAVARGLDQKLAMLIQGELK